MKKIFFSIVLLLFGINSAFGAHKFPEKYYQNKWCDKWKGIAEYKLNDDTRVDCLTKNYAVEFDFAPKWAEAIGQSLHYSRMTGKQPGIILIIEKPEDFKYYSKIVPLCKQYKIALWYMEMPQKYQNSEEAYGFSFDYIINLIFTFIKNIFDIFI